MRNTQKEGQWYEPDIQRDCEEGRVDVMLSQILDAPPSQQESATVADMRRTASAIWPDQIKRSILEWANVLEASEQNARNLAGEVEALQAQDRAAQVMIGSLQQECLRWAQTCHDHHQSRQSAPSREVDVEALAETLFVAYWSDPNITWDGSSEHLRLRCRRAAKAVVAAYEKSKGKNDGD